MANASTIAMIEAKHLLRAAGLSCRAIARRLSIGAPPPTAASAHSRTGEELVILKRGLPVARVVAARDSKPWLALRGRGELCGDPFDPVGIDGDLRTGESTFF